uniref:DNA repair protein XRCC1 n=1 Tax=Cacopsylla melanoneura TaxID=428564 RepID=A0A8D9FJB3_9HEMI
MAPVKFARIVSYSSEDPIHKADNLLNPQSTKKWKCKTMGEKQAIAILQLSRQVQINAVDIGNEYSAFVEVFAAKSSNPDEYKVLLPAVCMMSIQDSKQGVGINSVRFFKAESLLHADETWDRIKVVCSQPYNKCVQYGLAFITLHSATPEKVAEQTNTSTNSIANTQSPSSQKLGNFVLKDDPNESSPISLGNWFSKRKAISPPKEHVKVPKTSLASTIKDDSSPQLVKADKPKKPKKKKDDDLNGKIEVKTTDNGGARRAAGGPLMYVSDDDAKTNDGNSSSSTKNIKPSTTISQKNGQRKDVKKDTNGKDKKKDRDSQESKDSKDKKDTLKKIQTPLTPSNSQSSNPKYRTKPFHKLLEGVTFVISGFENPLRSDLRNQALEMGALYKANWESNCTHLICAFPNTPKCRSVQSLNGKIVTKDWISDCYNQCKRLPWRRYALLRADQGQSESEEEIHEEIQNKKISISLFQATASLSQATTSSSQATSALFQDTPTLSQASINSSKATPNSSQASNISSQAIARSSQSQSDSDTDIDDGPEFSVKLTRRKFPTIFQNMSFFIHSSLEDSLKNKLFRYITTYGGYCLCDGQSKHTPIPRPKADRNFDYICAETLNQDMRIKYAKSIWVKSDWIWECVEHEKLIANDKYKIKMETD